MVLSIPEMGWKYKKKSYSQNFQHAFMAACRQIFFLFKLIVNSDDAILEEFFFTLALRKTVYTVISSTCDSIQYFL